MRRSLVPILTAALAFGLISAAPASASKGHQVLEFGTMAPVTGPFLGSANPIRGVNGGLLPWQIDSARGELSSTGHLEVAVTGLVLLDAAPVPQQLQGTNPFSTFRAIVSCQTISGGEAGVVNVVTDPFPASSTGDSRIETDVSLPEPCYAPIVLVGPSGTTWFSVTGM